MSEEFDWTNRWVITDSITEELSIFYATKYIGTEKTKEIIGCTDLILLRSILANYLNLEKIRDNTEDSLEVWQ